MLPAREPIPSDVNAEMRREPKGDEQIQNKNGNEFTPSEIETAATDLAQMMSDDAAF